MTTNRIFYLQLVALFLTIFGARLWLIHIFGNSIPFWDQWDAEADKLFLPWVNGELTWVDLFTQHNEHRIFFPRLLSLGLLILNGREWNPLVEVVVNSSIFVFTGILLVVLFTRLLNEAVRGWLVFIVALLWSLPYAWENTLAGFQSAFYLMVLFSLIAAWGLLLHKNFSSAWWSGLISAVCAYFSLASGFFILLVIFTLKSYLFVTDGKKRWEHLPTLLASLIVSLGCFLLITKIPGYELMQPKQLDDFFSTLFKALAFPWVSYPWMSMALYFPFVAWVIKLLWTREKLGPAKLLVLTLGGWVILQALSMAYARGVNAPDPASRYMDVLALGLLANGLSFHFLLQTNVMTRFVQFSKLIWHGVVMLGIGSLLLTHTWPALQEKPVYRAAQWDNVRHFLHTKSLTALENKLPFHIPYPSAERLGGILQRLEEQHLLPYTLTLPKLLPFRQATPTFVPDGFYPTTGTYSYEIVMGSYGPQGNAATGRFETEFIHFPQRAVSIPIAGYLGEEGLNLQFEVKGESKPIEITLDKQPKESWELHILQLPDKPVKLVAIDNNPDYWFAFGMPRTMGALSFWTHQLLTYWWITLFLGISLFSFTLNISRKAL